MLSSTYFNNNSIQTYQEEIFPSLMLADGVLITSTLNWLKAKVIANIWCYLSRRKTLLHKENFQGILPTFMLASLVNLYSFSTRCINGRYIQQYMLAFLNILSQILWWKWPTFMLTLLGIFINIFLFIGEVKIPNILW